MDLTGTSSFPSVTENMPGGERRRKERSAQRSSLSERTEKGPSRIRPTLQVFQRQHWGNSSETGWSAYGPSRADGYHIELNWTELKACTHTQFFIILIIISSCFCCCSCSSSAFSGHVQIVSPVLRAKSAVSLRAVTGPCSFSWSPTSSGQVWHPMSRKVFLFLSAFLHRRGSVSDRF